jgi:hypothetical protein
VRLPDLLINDTRFTKSGAGIWLSGLFFSALALLSEWLGLLITCRLAMLLHHPWPQAEGPEGLHVYGSSTGGLLDLSWYGMLWLRLPDLLMSARPK